MGRASRCTCCNLIVMLMWTTAALASLVGSRQGVAGTEQEDVLRCPTARVMSTTAGVSLMQATSKNRRVSADQLSDEDLTDAHMFDALVVDRRKHRALRSSTGTDHVATPSGRLKDTSKQEVSAKTFTVTSLPAPRAAQSSAKQPSATAWSQVATVRHELNRTSPEKAVSANTSGPSDAESSVTDDQRIPPPPMSFVAELASQGHAAAESAAQLLAATGIVKDGGHATVRTIAVIAIFVVAGLVAHMMINHPQSVCCAPSSRSRERPDAREDAYESSTSDEAEVQFCPDLVVPRNCECELYMPIVGEAASSDTVVLQDASGDAVLHAVSEKPATKADQQPSWQFLLSTPSGTLQAKCVASVGEAGDREYQLLSAKGDLFGKLRKNSEREAYILTTESGRLFRFWGNFDEQAINVTSDSGRLLAHSESTNPDFDKSGSFIRVRIATLVDAGIVLCALLCISHHLG